MGALTIAFDTTIVGVLALPWVLVVIHLFFFEGEDRLGDILHWLKKQKQPAVVGVLLFAMTYTLGSAVSRTAQDFFNDDDLYLQADGQFFRVGVTEDRILTRVYCESDDKHLLFAEKEDLVFADKINTFQTFPAKKALCSLTMKWGVKYTYNRKDDELNETARDIFGLQENALMVKGGDFSVRLRQLHDQIMVLRGAAFDGVIGLSLCLFAWGVTVRREKARAWLRWMLVPVPALYLSVAAIATVHHFGEGVPSDPPYMEFTLLVLALAGVWLVWMRPSPPKPEATRAQETDAGKETGTKCNWQVEHWGRLVLLSGILTLAAVLGWWSTEGSMANK